MGVRVAFLGDTLLGGDAQPQLQERGYAYALEGIGRLVGDADLVVANQEGPITQRAAPVAKVDTGRRRYWYRAFPEATAALREVGVRVVSLANNHVLDFGLDGLADTICALDSAGIAHCGAGRDEAEARRPALISVGDLRVGFISCMQRYDVYVRERLYASGARGGVFRLRLSAVADELAALEEQVDLRVVLVHWGRNYRPVTPRQERLAAALRGVGADVVVGHHPHIPQRVDLSDGKPVLFSLGNGALGTRGRFHSGRPPFGLIATLVVGQDGRPEGIGLQAVNVDNAAVGYSPRLAVGPAANTLLRSVVQLDHGWVKTADGVHAPIRSAQGGAQQIPGP